MKELLLNKASRNLVNNLGPPVKSVVQGNYVAIGSSLNAPPAEVWMSSVLGIRRISLEGRSGDI